jgi:hypothetical protein
MDPRTLLLLVGVLACPIVMGGMMWWMTKNMGGHQDHEMMPGSKTPANSATHLAALRAQQNALKEEIAEVERLAKLETQHEALTRGSGSRAVTKKERE